MQGYAAGKLAFVFREKQAASRGVVAWQSFQLFVEVLEAELKPRDWRIPGIIRGLGYLGGIRLEQKSILYHRGTGDMG